MRRKKKVDPEAELLFQLRAAGVSMPKPQYRFAALSVGLGDDIRKRLAAVGLQDWRFDFAWPGVSLAAECEGGTWSGGRHVRGKGFEEDCRKYNSAVILGWRVLRFTTDQVMSGYALKTIEDAMGDKR